MLTTSRAPRYAGAAVFATFACAASAYFFLPSGPSRAAPTRDTEPLSADHFTPSVVLANDDASPDTKILTLRVDPSLVPLYFRRLAARPSGTRGSSLNNNLPIYSLFVKDSDIQVERPYTPLECVDDDGKMKVWVKQYEHGEVGRWLHSRKKGDVIELRGPITTWDWSWRPTRHDWDEVVMISGGTGIAPFYQFLHSIFAHPDRLQNDCRTRYTLLHAAKTPTDLPPPSILDPLLKFSSEHPDLFSMHLFVDAMPQDHPKKSNSLLPNLGRIGRADIERCLDLNGQNQRWWSFWWRKKEDQPQKTRLFLVCGPEPMINALCGPYGRNFSQGHVGGVLGDMGYTSREVWKL